LGNKPIPVVTKKSTTELGIVVHTDNPSPQEAGAGGSQVPGQPGLLSEITSKKEKKGLVEWLKW
jgi:hypothetical protein